jgi:NADH-quinone oxidoreductase subunit M
MNPLLIILLSPAVAVGVLFAVPGRKANAVRAVAAVFTGISLLAAVWLFLSFGGAPASEAAGDHVYKYVVSADWVPSIGLKFKLGVDGMGVAMVLLTAITIFTGVLVSFGIKTRVKEYYINLLALVTGVFGVFTALDLFFYYFFYELAVIPMFLLIGVWGSTTKTVDQGYATMKLVLLLSTGAVLALVGLIAVYAQAGTFDMVALERFEFSHLTQMIWFPVIFLGFATLVPMWPFHSWSPAGHAAAPAAVSMLHAGVLMKLGAFSILRIVCVYFPEAAMTYMPYVGILCCFNIIYGGLVAIWQRDLKLMVGYSSSSHMGYVLLGMASLTLVGIEGAIFLMFAHGIMTALTFALIGWFYDQTHTRMVDDLGGLMRVMPFAGTCFVIASMASAGLPGFANFVSEMMVIIGAWEGGMWSRIPAILAVWGLVVTGVYLLRAVKNVWYGDMPKRWEHLKDARTPLQKAPYVILVATLVIFGFFPQPMLDVIRQGARPIHARIQSGDDSAASREAAPQDDAASRKETGRVR